MANEVEINVVAHDRTDKGFAAAEARAKRLAASLTATLGKGGRAAGDGLAQGVDTGMQRAAKDAEKRAKDASDRIVKGFDGQGTGAKVGGSFATAFDKALSSKAPASGKLATTAIVAGLAALPAAAGVIGAAAGAALGAGLAGVGIAAAAQTERVKSEFADLKDDVTAGLRGISGPWERSLLKIPDVVRDVGRDLRPHLANAFADMAPAFDRFVEAVGKGVSSLGPALESVGTGFATVLDEIGDRAPEIFESLGSAVDGLGKLAQEHGDDLAAFFKVLADGADISVKALGYLATEFDKFVTETKRAFGEDFWFRTPDHVRAMEDAAASAGGRVDAVLRQIGRAATDAASEVGDLKTQFDDLNADSLDVEEAQTRFAEALARAKKAIKENGEAWDRNTKAGIDNHAQAEALARIGQQSITTLSRQKGGIDAAAKAYLDYRESIASALTTAIGSRKEAEKYTAELLGMPKSVRTELKGDVTDLSKKIGDARLKLQDPKLTRPKATKIQANIDKLIEARNRAAAALASLHNKDIKITAHYITYRDVINRSFAGNSVTGAGRARGGEEHGGIIGAAGFKGFQSGGISGAGSTTALVGEAGPELVRLPVGSTVVPAGQSASMMSASAARAASSISMAFRAPSSSGGGEDVSRSLKDLTKTLRDVISLREGMSHFTDHVLGQGRAFIAYEAALDRAAASVKKNGRTLNIGREKGRENRSALMDLASAAHEAAFAMADLGRPASAITARMKEQRAEFLRVARSMGLTTKEAKALADKWGLLPSTVKSILAKETKDKAYNRAAEKFNATLKTRASGGPAGGMTLVGESGPELVRLPFGSNVTPAGQTAAMMGGAAGGMGGPLHITLNIGGQQLGELILDPLRKTIRTRGGDVQAVLGRK